MGSPIVKRLGLAAAATVGTLLAAELAFRGAEAAGWVTVEVPESAAPPPTGDDEPTGVEARALLHPYLGWIDTPGTRVVEALTTKRLILQTGSASPPPWADVTTNRFGFAGDLEAAFDRPRGTGEGAGERPLLVLVTGGSVARWFALQGGPRLEERLSAALDGREVRVLNAATGGYKQPQQALAVAYVFSLGATVDLVLNLDGFNELVFTDENVRGGVAAVYPGRGHWSHLLTGVDLGPSARAAIAAVEREVAAAGSALARAERYGGASRIAAWVFARRASEHHRRAEEAQLAYREAIEAAAERFVAAARRGPFREGDDPRAQAVEAWAAGSRSLAGLCEAHGAAYVHALQPTPHDSGAKPLTTLERQLVGPASHRWAVAAREGYPLLRERGAELAADGVRFVDLTRLFAGTEGRRFYDVCHLDQTGNEELADALVEPLAAALAQRPR